MQVFYKNETWRLTYHLHPIANIIAIIILNIKPFHF